MTQYAIVKKMPAVGKAEVEVMRGTACGDCGSCEVCKYTSKIRVEAVNNVGAEIGDNVEIETKSSSIIGAAFLVYIVPFILFFVGYAIAAKLHMAEGASIIMSFAFFAVGMLIAVIVGRGRKKDSITYTITRILDHGEAYD
jgi:sigma-E factor negative regulatory protein RseC